MPPATHLYRKLRRGETLREIGRGIVLYGLLAALCLCWWGSARGQACYTDPATGQRVCSGQQKYQREMIVPQRVRWDDKRIVRFKRGGTGSMVSIGGKPFIASCAHDSPGKPPVRPGYRQKIQANDGSEVVATVVASDPQGDCSLWSIGAKYNGPTLTIPDSPPEPGTEVYTAGFPMLQQLRVRRLQVGYYLSDDAYAISAPSVSGESGAPMIANGDQLVGVLVGGIEGHRHTLCCGVRPLRRLRDQVRSRVCPADVAPGSTVGAQHQQRPYRQQMESAIKRLREEIKQSACKCDDTPSDIDYSQFDAKIEASVRSWMKSHKNELRGADGEDGRDGRDAEITKETMNQILVSVVERLPATEAPQQSTSEHIVVVVDRNAPWWERLSEDINKTKQTYSGIRVTGLPPFPIGEIPQAVVYENSVPVRIVKGEREVLDLLSRIRRGMSI